MATLLRRNASIAALVVAIFALDQLTKLAVTQNLALGESWPRTGFFRITHVANSGSAFGLFGGQNFVLTAIAVVGIVLIVWFFRAAEQRILVRTALGVMLAGALGNLTDRLVNGRVTDFIDVGPWYIFNVADSAIVVGVLVLAVSALFEREAPPDQQSDPPAAEPETVASTSQADDEPSP